MVIDSSALVAIVNDEPERAQFEAAILGAHARFVSAPTVLETSMVIEAQHGDAAAPGLEALIRDLRLEVMHTGPAQIDIAREGWRKFGKGRHPAALNFGDLFSYSLAIETGEPLLFKGDDFRETDVVAAV